MMQIFFSISIFLVWPVFAAILSTDIKSTINPMYLKPEAQGQGGGTPPNKQSGNNVDASKMTETQRTELFKNNPTEFNRMFGQK